MIFNTDYVRERIIELAEQKGVVKSSFTQFLGMKSRSAYSNLIEKKSYNKKLIALIAEYFNVSIDYFVQNSNKEETIQPETKQPMEESERVKNLKEQVSLLKEVVQAQKELSGSALIETKDKLIKNLEDTIIDLRGQIEELKRKSRGNNDGVSAKTA